MLIVASRQWKAPLALQAEINHLKKSSELRTMAFNHQPSSTALPGPDSAEEQEAIYGHQQDQSPSSPKVQGTVWREACYLTCGGLRLAVTVPGLWPGPALHP